MTIEKVSLNPTRAHFLVVLERMGLSVEVMPRTESVSSEPIGNILIRSDRELVSTVVSPQEVPALIDEIPILAVAASQCTGMTTFEGVGELRVKESDRLAAIESGLSAMGVSVEIDGDDLSIKGPCDLKKAELDSLGDHRLAMAWTVAGLVAEGGMSVDGAEAVDVSYPGFYEDLAFLGL